MPHRILLILCCAAVALITGCADAPQIPTGLLYSPPQTGVPIATIKGSEEKSALLDNFTAFVVKVDGKLVTAGRKGWNTPIPIVAGHRFLTVEFNRGVFVALADLDFEAVANASYQVKYGTDVWAFGNSSYVDFWIADTATSKAISAIKRVAVTQNGNAGAMPVVTPVVK